MLQWILVINDTHEITLKITHNFISSLVNLEPRSVKKTCLMLTNDTPVQVIISPETCTGIVVSGRQQTGKRHEGDFLTCTPLLCFSLCQANIDADRETLAICA